MKNSSSIQPRIGRESRWRDDLWKAFARQQARGSLGMAMASLLSFVLLVSCAQQPPTAQSPKPPETQVSTVQVVKPTVPPAQPTAAKPAGEAAKEAPPTAVRIGEIGSSSDALFYIASERGYFKAEGLAAELVRFDSAARMIAPLGAGQLDVGGGSISPGLFNAIQRGVPIKIVADRCLLSPGRANLGLLVRKDLIDSGRIRDFADLKGKNIAINSKGTGTEIQLERALALGKVARSDVNVVEMGFPDVLTALQNKTIDAGFAVEPLVTIGAQRGISVRWKGGDELYPNHQIGVLLYGPDFWQKRPDAAKNFMVAYLRAIRDFINAFDNNKGKEDIISILTRTTDIKDATTWSQMVPCGVNPDGYLGVPSITSDQDWYVANGYMEKKVDLAQMVDTQFVDYAVGKLGKYSR